jgi:hypothetical protein
MDYNRYTRSVQISYWKVYNDGTAVAPVERLKAYSTGNLLVGRDSNDIGEFIPGVYRINPYCIARFNQRLEESLVKRDYQDTSAVYTRQDEGPVAMQPIFMEYLTSPGITDVGPYEQLALQKAMSKVGAAELAMGEDLGELRETYNMLKSPLSAMKKFLLDDSARNLNSLVALAKKGKRVAEREKRTALGAADAVSGTILELRYGLRPLMMQVQAIIELLCAKAEEAFDPTKIRSVRTRLIFTTETSKDRAWTLQNFYKGTVHTENTYQASASIQYRQTAEHDILSMLGLKPQYLLETAWNLKTLSFVFDWLLDVGTFLESVRFKPDIEILGNTVGVKTIRKAKIDNIEARYNNYCKWETVRNTSEATYEIYNRKINVSMQYRPHFTYGRTFDLWKKIDLAAILWAPISKKLRKIKV